MIDIIALIQTLSITNTLKRGDLIPDDTDPLLAYVSKLGGSLINSYRVLGKGPAISYLNRNHDGDNLTVEKIRNGNSNIRNPILVSFIARGLLPYRGLGSGIKRALEDWPYIDFIDDRDGGLFTAPIHRKWQEGSEKSSEKIIALMKEELE